MTSGMYEAFTTLLICVGIGFIILSLGEIIYRIEMRWQRDRDYRRSKTKRNGKQFHQNSKDRKHRQGVGEDRS